MLGSALTGPIPWADRAPLVPGFLIYETKHSPCALPPTPDDGQPGGRSWGVFSTQSLGLPLSAGDHLARKHTSNMQGKGAASRLLTASLQGSFHVAATDV